MPISYQWESDRITLLNNLYGAMRTMDSTMLSGDIPAASQIVQIARQIVARVIDDAIRAKIFQRLEDGLSRLSASDYELRDEMSIKLAQIAVGEVHSYFDSVFVFSSSNAIGCAGDSTDLKNAIQRGGGEEIVTSIPKFNLHHNLLQEIVAAAHQMDIGIVAARGGPDIRPLMLARQVIIRIPDDNARDRILMRLDDMIATCSGSYYLDRSHFITFCAQLAIGDVFGYLDASIGLSESNNLKLFEPLSPKKSVIPNEGPHVGTDITDITSYMQIRTWFHHLRVLWRCPDRVTAPPPTLAQMIATKITSPHNKDYKLALVGPMGSGKSRSLLYLACETAKAIATIRDHDSAKWPNYFSLDNVSIGDPQGHAQALQSIKKYNIYILDDAGVSLDARNFATTYNKTLNHIIQTCRTDNAVIFMSAPDMFLFDKVPRLLVSAYAEIGEQYHDQGFNLVKVFVSTRNYRDGTSNSAYMLCGKTKMRRYIFANPPDDIITQYEELRTRATQHIKDLAHKVNKPSKPTRALNVDLELICERITTQNQSISGALRDVNVSRNANEQISRHQVYRYMRNKREKPEF
jgi:hypothetical protein